MSFEAGDLFVFYTDGVTDAENAGGADFGQERLLDVVRQNHDRSARSLVSAVHAAIDQFQGPGAQGDDATVIVVRVPREEVT